MDDSTGQTGHPVASTWSRRAAVLGAVVLALVLFMHLIAPVREARTVCARGADILAFELARTPADLAAVFGPAGSACESAMTQAMVWLNRIDLPFFIAAWFLFLCAAVLHESARNRQRRWLWGLLAATVALAGDLLETTLMLQISRKIDDPAAMLAPLSIATWIKWCGLGAFGALAAWCGWHAAPRRWLLACAGAAVVGTTLAVMTAGAALAPAMALANAVLWLLLWSDAVRATGWLGRSASD